MKSSIKTGVLEVLYISASRKVGRNKTELLIDGAWLRVWGDAGLIRKYPAPCKLWGSRVVATDMNAFMPGSTVYVKLVDPYNEPQMLRPRFKRAKRYDAEHDVFVYTHVFVPD
jgi:hypothetical protein